VALRIAERRRPSVSPKRKWGRITRGLNKIEKFTCAIRSSTIIIAPFGDAYEKIGTIQRRLAWPLHKDDTLFQSGRPTGLNIYFAFSFFHFAQLALGKSAATCTDAVEESIFFVLRQVLYASPDSAPISA
jgi:hypothetical protein